MFNGIDFTTMLGHRFPIVQTIVQQTGTVSVPLVTPKGPDFRVVILSVMVAGTSVRGLRITDGQSAADILSQANSTLMLSSPFGFFAAAAGQGVSVDSITATGTTYLSVRYVVVPVRDN